MPRGGKRIRKGRVLKSAAGHLVALAALLLCLKLGQSFYAVPFLKEWMRWTLVGCAFFMAAGCVFLLKRYLSSLR